MHILGVFLVLLVVAFFGSLFVAFVFNVVAGALSILPAVFVIVAVWFFVKGGRIRIDFPDRDDRDRFDR